MARKRMRWFEHAPLGPQAATERAEGGDRAGGPAWPRARRTRVLAELSYYGRAPPCLVRGAHARRFTFHAPLELALARMAFAPADRAPPSLRAMPGRITQRL